MSRRLRSSLFVRSLEDRALPAVFTVLNLNDAGAGSLRDAVVQANAAPGDDTIDFQSGLSGTIKLTTGEIAINNAVSLDGPGATKISVSGNSTSRIFNLFGAPAGAAVSMSGLTLTQGKSQFGSAIAGLEQQLTLTNCVLTANTATTLAGAVNLQGVFTATGCSFTNNTSSSQAGAIAIQGSASKAIFKGCTISGNTANSIGALYVRNYLLMEDSTVSGNSATGNVCGGIYAFSTFPAGALTIRNSTVSGNSAKNNGGGIVLTSLTGTLVVQNSTITANSAGGNGGGIFRGSGTGTVQLESSILAQNTSTGGTPDFSFNAATAVTANNSIVGVADKGNATVTGVNLQKGTAVSPLNAVLSTLGNFGGPTLTHHPLAGSPAIDKGANPTALSSDQRGQPREFNGTADIGALEINPAKFTVSTTTDENDGNFAVGDLSLREAVLLANSSPASADTVDFQFNGTHTLTLDEIGIAGPVTVQGTTADKLKISGNNAKRIFNLTAPAGAAVSFSNLSLINGKAFFGGALRTAGQVVSLSNCILTGNATSGGGGGAIAGYSGGGSVSLTDCTLSNNTAVGFGGAIDALGATTTKYVLTRCTVSGNSASTGGGLYVNTYLLLDSCTVSGNTATGASATGLGGGVRAAGTFAAGALTIRNSTISGNSAKTDGGGIAIDNFGGTLVLQNSTITANSATGQGGGIARVSGTGTVQLDSSIVAQNTSTGGTPDLFFNALTNVTANASIIGVADKGNINLSGTGTQTGTLALPLNAKLASLAAYGGPTQTHRPLAGSPALDLGSNPAGLTTDQRGLNRVFGVAADVGAVEITPQNFVVDQPVDENDANFGAGDFSLREALNLANEHASTADTVTFAVKTFQDDPFDFVYEIKLTLGQLTVTGPAEITWAEKYPLTVNANGLSRVLNVDGAAAGTAISVTGLRLTGGKTTGGGGGNSGGAVLAGDEVLTFTRCVITGNQATTSFGGGVAMVGAGQLTMTDCVVTNNTASSSGGGICEIGGAGASVTLTRCEISGNTSFQGGGVYARNQFLMDGCTVSGNSCPQDTGGGIHLGQQTGSGTAVVRNSTISGNLGEFGGGIATIYSFKGTLQVQNCTIVGNHAVETGGGLFRGGNFATFDIVSSIVAGNTADDGAPDIRNQGLVNVNFSAIGSPIGFTPTGANNLSFGTDLKLGPLQLNGGPTPTHALLAGSPAVDKGSNPAGLTTDQRGPTYSRNVNGKVDIGAYETAKVFLVTNTNDSGAGSLRKAALDAGQSPSEAGLVRFDPAVFGTPQTITLTGGQISLFYSVEIQGPGAGLLTISGNGASSIFFTGGTFVEGDAVFSGLTLTGGKSTHGGAIATIGSRVIIRDSVVSGNTATTGGGGGMFINTGRLVMERCTVANNTAIFYGGGLYFFSRGTFSITDSTISGNSVTNGQGGGLYFFNASYAPAHIRNSTISGNTAKFEGGGIALNFRGNLRVQNSTITKNTSSSFGGGIGRFGGQGDVTLQSTIVAQNTGSAGPDISFQAVIGTVFADNSIIGAADALNLTLSGTGNQTGTVALPVDAKLSTLQSFGGPTLTHVPLAGSPAVDKGSNVAKLVFDQRGLPRAFNNTPDVGSVEVHPATFVVDIALDENDGNFGKGDLSLREALALANASAATADTVTFDPVVFGSFALNINLSLGELGVSGPVNVIGPGADLLTVSGLNASRIFITTSAPAATEISVSGLRLTSGKADFGGAIRGADERITLTNCVLSANAATSNGGAIYINNGGWLTATGCTFSANTAGSFIGGIDVFGTGAKTVLRSSTVSDNSSVNGGGLYVANYLLVENCTISGNKSTAGDSGGMYIAGTFAAGALTIRNSTVSGNSAAKVGGGILLAGFVGTLDLQNSTVTNNSAGTNGGGIGRSSGSGTVNLASAIVAQNTGGAGAPDLFFNAAAAVTANNSIIGVTDKGSFGVGGSGNQTGLAAAPFDAKLGPLGDNGGPTRSHRPLAGSPALDKGANALALTFDQRGAPRTAGAGTDVGAVEVQSAVNLVVDITADENDGNISKGDLSLREALAIASGSVESVDTITFDPAVFGSQQTITLTLGEISIGGPVLVEGPGTKLLTLSGNKSSRIFNTAAAPLNTLITLTDMTFVDGMTARLGGAIVAVNEKLQLADCVFTGNVSTSGSFTGGGGAVAVYSVASLEATDCTFTSNTAAKGRGGAIFAQRINAQTLTLRRCTVSGNSALFGGGIYSNRAILLEDSTVSGNTAPAGNGGGIFLYPYDSSGASVGTIRNSTISGNSAALVGGGIRLTNDAATLLIQNSTIVNNSVAGGQGGGIFNPEGATTITLVSSIVANNSAGTGPDIFSAGPVNAATSLVGSTAGVTTFNPDATTTALLGKNPLLGPLTNNGGPTQTHALLPGSPAVNAGSNPAGLTTDQRGSGFVRDVNGADIGAFEVQAAPPTAAIQVNDGTAQRSMVTSFKVAFSEAVSFPSGLAAAFLLQRTGPGSPLGQVALAFAPAGNVVTITFTDPTFAPVGGSLIDGNYTLTLVASKIQGAGGFLDGDGNGTGGDDRVLLTHRLFGDADGDRDVDAVDYGAFRAAFGNANFTFDFDNDGDVDAVDFGQFRSRFGASV